MKENPSIVDILGTIHQLEVGFINWPQVLPVSMAELAPSPHWVTDMDQLLLVLLFHRLTSFCQLNPLVLYSSHYSHTVLALSAWCS